MTKSRQWTIGTALVALVVLVVGMMLFVQPRRSQASALKDQTATQETANQSLQAKIANLKAQQQDLPKQQAVLDTIRQQIPTTPNLPSLVRSLTDLAKSTGVELVALAPANPQPLTEAKSSATGGSAGTAPSSGTTPSGAGVASNVQQIPIKITVIGSYTELTTFLNRLETLQRALAVQEVNVSLASAVGVTGGSTASTDLQMELSTLAFMAPKAAAATSQAPTGSTDSGPASATNNQ